MSYLNENESALNMRSTGNSKVSIQKKSRESEARTGTQLILIRDAAHPLEEN
jgi:hypothetical protein